MADIQNTFPTFLSSTIEASQALQGGSLDKAAAALSEVYHIGRESTDLEIVRGCRLDMRAIRWWATDAGIDLGHGMDVATEAYYRDLSDRESALKIGHLGTTF